MILGLHLPTTLITVFVTFVLYSNCPEVVVGGEKVALLSECMQLHRLIQATAVPEHLL